MTKYAQGTTVKAEATQGEIRGMLAKAGATHYAFGDAPERALIQFRLDGRHYRFDVERPTVDALRAEYIEDRRANGDGEYRATTLARAINWQIRTRQEWDRRWRARLLWLKAQLEFASEVPLEQSLLSNLVLPDGRTFGGWAVPQIDLMYEQGQMPPLLGDGR